MAVFAQGDGGWRIDELIGLTPDGLTVANMGDATPPPIDGTWPQMLEVRLNDDGGRTWNAPTNNLAFRASTDVYVTLANLGTAPHRFEVPDLGMRIVVPPGQSVSFVLSAEAGSYDVQSFTQLENGEDAAQLRGVLEFIPEGEIIPMG